MRSVRKPSDLTFGLLVRFGSSDPKNESIGVLDYVLNLKSDQFAATQCAGIADQYERSVSYVDLSWLGSFGQTTAGALERDFDTVPLGSGHPAAAGSWTTVSSWTLASCNNCWMRNPAECGERSHCLPFTRLPCRSRRSWHFLRNT